jgi:hypothetical protein
VKRARETSSQAVTIGKSFIKRRGGETISSLLPAMAKFGEEKFE